MSQKAVSTINIINLSKKIVIKKMKPFLMGLAMLFSINASFSQTYGYDTTQYYGKINWIFYNLNTSTVTSGLLRDYGIDFLNLDNYTGAALNDSNYVSLDEWRLLYGSLYSQQISTSTGLLYLDTLNRLFNNNSQSTQPINFATMYYTYQTFLPNAVSGNLIRIANGQLFDVAGRTQSPYTNEDLFAFAPLRQGAFTGSNQLVFSSSMFFGNTGKTVSSIQVDAKGTGNYQTVSLNVPFSISYDTAGFYDVNIKITYTGGIVKTGHTKLAVYATPGNGVALNENNFSAIAKGTGPPYHEASFIYGNHYPYYPVSITATKPYQGSLAQGDYTIDLSVNNTTGKIKKPLIVVEGFDPDGTFIYATEYLKRITYDINYGPSDYLTHPIPLNGTSGLDNADSYDIIYLHWKNSTDYIQRNAYLLETLIQWVNTQKAANGSTEQNVVLGFSMGGLVARYALRDMEINNMPHQTRLFISHDVPHWGANVPVAAQAAVQQLAPWKIINIQGSARFPYFSINWPDMIPSAVDGLNLFNSPGAKQMLIQRYTLVQNTLTADNSAHTAFMNEINGMGWPLNCRNITLSNGACNGTKIYPDNSIIAQISGNRSMTYFGALYRSLILTIGGLLTPTTVLTGGPGHPEPSGWAMFWQFPLSIFSTKSTIGLNFSLNSVPASGTSRIYTGDIYSTKKILGLINVTNYFVTAHVNSTSDMLPLDNAPGGEYSLTQFGFDVSKIQSQLPKFFQGYVQTTITQPNFCFVPTVSALAITNAQQNLLTNICSTVNCLNPTQVSDYYAPQVNQLHVSYTTDNSNWILQEQSASYSCAKICGNNILINGDNNFCTTSNPYTIANLPANTTVVWSATPAGIVQINTPNANSTALTKTGTGQVTLTATINNGCSPNQNFTVAKTIVMGTPMPTYINVLPDVCPQYGFNTNSIGNATYTWQFHKNPYSNNEEIFPNKGSNVKLNIDQGSGSYNVGVTAVNACGSSSMFYITTNINCGGSPHIITVSPNPSTGDVTVSTPADASQQLMADAALNSTSSKSKTVSTPSKIYQIKVLGQTGNVLKQFSYPSGTTSTNINLSSFANGVYILQIYDNVSWTSQQVVILK